jgi:hypothetical protein
MSETARRLFCGFAQLLPFSMRLAECRRIIRLAAQHHGVKAGLVFAIEERR